MTGNCDDSEQATTIEPLSPRRGSDNKSTFIIRPRPRSFCSTAATVASDTTPTMPIDKIKPYVVVPAVKNDTQEILIKPEINDDCVVMGQTSLLPSSESKHIVTQALVHAVDA